MRLVLQMSFPCPGWLAAADARLSEFGDRADLARRLGWYPQALSNVLSGVRATCPLNAALQMERLLRADLLGADREAIALELERMAATVRGNLANPEAVPKQVRNEGETG